MYILHHVYFLLYKYSRYTITIIYTSIILCILSISISYVLYTSSAHANTTFFSDDSSTEESSSFFNYNVIPALDWIVDPSGQLTINQILSAEIQRTFLSFMFTQLPKEEGTFWFRFTIDSTTSLLSPNLILDLNKRLPAQFPEPAQVWLVSMGSGKGKLLTPIEENIYSITRSNSEIFEVYIRLPGAPGFGFSPILWTENTFPGIYPSVVTSFLCLLVLTMLFCIVRAFIEKQEWRIWAALYTGTIIISVLWGIPPTPDGILTIWDMPGLLAPSIALFILPHIGRRIMQTRNRDSSIDTQLLLLTLPGLMLSFFPLLPSYIWTLPYISLWPLVTLIFLPTTFLAIRHELQNSKLFFVTCILPPLGMLPYAIPLSFIPSFIPTTLLNLLPLATLSVSSLLTVLINRQKTAPNIRLVSSPFIGKSLIVQPDMNIEETSISNKSGEKDIDILEQKLRTPLDRILKELTILNLSLRSTPLQQHVETIENTTEYLSRVIKDIPELFLSNPHIEKEVFDLNQLLFGIHEAIKQDAEAKNLAFSWFIAPHLAQKYEGNPTQLAQVLYLLVENAVQATHKGIVQLTVQRVSESTDPGHLLITVSDSGQGAPPLTRSPLALIHAWELANNSGGIINMRSDSKGTSISFSIHLIAKNAGETLLHNTRQDTHIPSAASVHIPRIIIADIIHNNRQLITYYLDELPYEILEAQDNKQLYELYKKSPGALIIFGQDMPEHIVAEAIGSIRVFEGDHNFPLAPILAICKTEHQVEKVLRVGCTHTILEPVTRKDLRHVTLQLAPIPHRVQAMVNTSHKDISWEQPYTASIPSNTILDMKTFSQSTNRLLQSTNNNNQKIRNFSEITNEVTKNKEIDIEDINQPVQPINLLENAKNSSDKPNYLSSKNTSYKKASLSSKKESAFLQNEKPYSKMEQYSLMNTAEWVGEPIPIIKKQKEAPDFPKIVTNSLHYNSEEWVGEPTSITNTNLNSNSEQPTYNTFYDTSDWVGEPTPVATNTNLTPNPEQPSYTTLYNSSDWVGEPTPVATNTNLTPNPEQPSYTTLYNSSDWVGEPTPVATNTNLTPNPEQPSYTTLYNSSDGVSEPTLILSEKNYTIIQKNYPLSSQKLSYLNDQQDIVETLSENIPLIIQSNNNEKDFYNIPSTTANTKKNKLQKQATQHSIKLNNDLSANEAQQDMSQPKEKSNERQIKTSHIAKKNFRNTLSLLDMITISNDEEQNEKIDDQKLISTQGSTSLASDENVITLLEPIAYSHTKNVPIPPVIPNLFDTEFNNEKENTLLSTEISSQPLSEENTTEPFDMMKLFSSTVELVEKNTTLDTSNELINELNITLSLLQEAIKTKQSENLVSFSQALISLSEQLQIETLTTLSCSLLQAIQTKEQAIIEQIIMDMRVEVDYIQPQSSMLL